MDLDLGVDVVVDDLSGVNVGNSGSHRLMAGNPHAWVHDRDQFPLHVHDATAWSFPAAVHEAGITGGSNGVLQSPLCSAPDPVAGACDRLWRNLSEAGWRSYIGDRPYERGCGNFPWVCRGRAGPPALDVALARH